MWTTSWALRNHLWPSPRLQIEYPVVLPCNRRIDPRYHAWPFRRLCAVRSERALEVPIFEPYLKCLFIEQCNSVISILGTRHWPSPITAATLASSDKNIKQSINQIIRQAVIHTHLCLLATQAWCLARLLPLIIGKEVPMDDEYWENYLLLLEMLDYIFAPTLTPEALVHLKILIINGPPPGF